MSYPNTKRTAQQVITDGEVICAAEKHYYQHTGASVAALPRTSDIMDILYRLHLLSDFLATIDDNLAVPAELREEFDFRLSVLSVRVVGLLQEIHARYDVTIEHSSRILPTRLRTYCEEARAKLRLVLTMSLLSDRSVPEIDDLCKIARGNVVAAQQRDMTRELRTTLEREELDRVFRLASYERDLIDQIRQSGFDRAHEREKIVKKLVAEGKPLLVAIKESAVPFTHVHKDMERRTEILDKIRIEATEAVAKAKGISFDKASESEAVRFILERAKYEVVMESYPSIDDYKNMIGFDKWMASVRPARPASPPKRAASPPKRSWADRARTKKQ